MSDTTLHDGITADDCRKAVLDSRFVDVKDEPWRVDRIDHKEGVLALGLMRADQRREIFVQGDEVIDADGHPVDDLTHVHHPGQVYCPDDDCGMRVDERAKRFVTGLCLIVAAVGMLISDLSWAPKGAIAVGLIGITMLTLRAWKAADTPPQADIVPPPKPGQRPPRPRGMPRGSDYPPPGGGSPLT